MNTYTSLEKTLQELKTDSVILNAGLPLGYGYGYPAFELTDGTMELIIPFLKYKVTGYVDQTLVFPIRYVFTFQWPSMQLKHYEDLKKNSRFAAIAFDSPVGVFRHEAIRTLSRQQYVQNRSQLFTLYDFVLKENTRENVITSGTKTENEKKFKLLLNQLLEPSLFGMYEELAPIFSGKYLR